MMDGETHNMKAFYGQMNQEREPDRTGKWMNHRQEISHLINQSIGQLPLKDEVIILGAGNCDDLDLPYLVSRFHSVSLADIDGEAMRTALSGLDPSLHTKINLIDSVDFTGLDQIGFYARFQSLLDNHSSAAQIVSLLKEAANEVNKKPVFAQLRMRFDVVISSAVHTQLFYLHALSLFAVFAKLYVKADVKLIVDGIADLRDFLLAQYNAMLCSLVRSDGVIIMYTDIILLDQQTNFFAETMYSLVNEAERAQYMLRLMGSYGIESAVFSLQDLNEKLASQHKLLRSWIWPFNLEKQFITVGIAGRLKT
jgi:hypothetical protein